MLSGHLCCAWSTETHLRGLQSEGEVDHGVPEGPRGAGLVDGDPQLRILLCWQLLWSGGSVWIIPGPAAPGHAHPHCCQLLG